MTPVPTTSDVRPSGLGWPVDVSRETSAEQQAEEPGHPSGLGWPKEDSR